MLKNRTKGILVLFSVLCFWTGLIPVYAVNYADYSRGSYGYTYNHTNGSNVKKVTSGANDWVKKLNGQLAYCIQFKSSINTPNYYMVDSSWKLQSKRAIIAGKIVDLVNSKYSGAEAYGMTAITLNTYFAKELGNTKSRGYCLKNCGSSDGNWYANNSNIKSFIDSAKAYYNDEMLSSTLPTPKYTVANKVLNYSSSGAYISDKITLSELVSTYGGSAVNYTISLSVSGSGSASICSKADGTGCTSSVSISSKTSYSFYIKGTGVDVNSIIKVQVNGKNSSSYLSSVKYINNKNKSDQPLLVKSSFDISRTTNSILTLTVPDTTNYRIVAYKLDSIGELLKGASLEIHKDSADGNVLASNDGNSSVITYTSPKEEVGAGEFFKHDYYLVEKKAPDGYVLSGTAIQFYIANSIDPSVKTEICYYNGGDETEESVISPDSERCNFDAYQMMCDTPSGFQNTTEDGNCTFSVSSGDETDTGDSSSDGSGDSSLGEGGGEVVTPPEIVNYDKVCVKDGTTKVDDTYCTDKSNYTKVSSSSGTLVVIQPNVKNVIKISKRGITGDEEIAGANLKICTKASYEEKKEECTPATTIDDISMSWMSGGSPYEFSGLKVGDYYIVEVTPPAGYVQATTATPFSIDAYGTVKSGDTTIKNEDFLKNNGTIVIHNQLNHFTISKTDIATSKELPGATISICLTYEDDNGNIKLHEQTDVGGCLPVTLADGTDATWVSSDKPKEISGLPAGTYYLVENIAPNGYSTAESILFTMKSDGTLVDKDGKSLKDSKLLMKDDPIKDVKTGMSSIYMIFGILVVVVGLGTVSYYYLNQKSSSSVNKDKIRKRKIHKSNF